MMTRGEIKMFY